ncbi:hypothetical protein [Flavobacterium sp. B17]|uniref:hypothetical protein n=1 Tax=Flavobacterium sp. B17 TaxID=95618 RepID=UPI00131F0358|nr:hypothetical protein [Flavobacterium sp. B17]
MQGCNTFSDVPESLSQGCNGFSDVPESFLQVAARFREAPKVSCIMQQGFGENIDDFHHKCCTERFSVVYLW